MRRLPIYILIDSSAGMSGERKELLTNNIHSFVSKCRCEANLIEDLAISCISVNSSSLQIFPLTYLPEIVLKSVQFECFSFLDLKTGLNHLEEIIIRDKILPYHPRYSGSKPIVVLFISRNPVNDFYNELTKILPHIDLILSYSLSNNVDSIVQKNISNYGINMIDEQIEYLPIFFDWLLILFKNRLNDFNFSIKMIPENSKLNFLK